MTFNDASSQVKNQKLNIPTPTADDLCYYHRSFGQVVRNCTKPRIVRRRGKSTEPWIVYPVDLISTNLELWIHQEGGCL